MYFGATLSRYGQMNKGARQSSTPVREVYMEREASVAAVLGGDGFSIRSKKVLRACSHDCERCVSACWSKKSDKKATGSAGRSRMSRTMPLATWGSTVAVRKACSFSALAVSFLRSASPRASMWSAGSSAALPAPLLLSSRTGSSGSLSAGGGLGGGWAAGGDGSQPGHCPRRAATCSHTVSASACSPSVATSFLSADPGRPASRALTAWWLSPCMAWR
mmetsp:Transcript_29821/g.40969  ORF Transcript_29821/g.40969 Transcript_29821/m.40969 type:complete len:219 (+) Transcript_29821:63-719(+)